MLNWNTHGGTSSHFPSTSWSLGLKKESRKTRGRDPPPKKNTKKTGRPSLSRIISVRRWDRMAKGHQAGPKDGPDHDPSPALQEGPGLREGTTLRSKAQGEHEGMDATVSMRLRKRRRGGPRRCLKRHTQISPLNITRPGNSPSGNQKVMLEWA